MNTPMVCEFCRFCTQYTYGRQCDNVKSVEYGKRVILDHSCDSWEETYDTEER